MRKKVVVLHTLANMVNDFKSLFAETLPEVELINIVDDSLIQEALAYGGITQNARKRYLHYALAADGLGAAAILNQCSSYSECADLAGQIINTPIYKIDEPMAKQANALGQKIAVIITARCSLGPSVRLVESHGTADTVVTPCFVEGAYDALLQENDLDKHDRLVIAAVEKAALSNDVIVMAQGSMGRLVPMLSHIGKPVLTSIESGISQLRAVL